MNNTITDDPPGPPSVLAFLLSKGIESGPTSIEGKRWTAGKKVHVRQVVWRYGVHHRAARRVLKELVAAGLVKNGGRGRHAAWTLTETGIKAAQTPSAAVAHQH